MLDQRRLPMTEYCKEMLWAGRQCGHNAKSDGYCGIHHPDAVKRRREKSEVRYKKWSDEQDKSWARKAFNQRAGDRCRELGIQPEDIKA